MSTRSSPLISASSTLFVYPYVLPMVDMVASFQRFFGSVEADPSCGGASQADSGCCAPHPSTESATTTISFKPNPCSSDFWYLIITPVRCEEEGQGLGQPPALAPGRYLFLPITVLLP